jgi:hypothetical protein
MLADEAARFVGRLDRSLLDGGDGGVEFRGGGCRDAYEADVAQDSVASETLAEIREAR